MSDLAELWILTEARAARADRIARHERSIEQLRACTCGYPTIQFHNGHGHADVCPAVKLIQGAPQEIR